MNSASVPAARNQTNQRTWVGQKVTVHYLEKVGILVVPDAA